MTRWRSRGPSELPTPFRALLVASCLLLICSVRPALAVSDLTGFHLEWAWSVGGSAIGAVGMALIDLDGDGSDEIVAAASAHPGNGYWYVLSREGDELAQTWSSLPLEDGVVALRVYREGAASRIVVVGESSVLLYDGLTKDLLATFSTISTDNRAADVGDVDGDGGVDVAICDTTALHVYALPTGSVRTQPGFGCRAMAIGQTDADPQLEIALAGNTPPGLILDGLSLAVDWTDPRGFGLQVRLGDFDGDGKDEVASRAPDLSGLRVQDPETSTLLWELLGSNPASIAAANLDGMPGEELLWYESTWGPMHVANGANGVDLYAFDPPAYGPVSLASGDTDGDGTQEIVWGSSQASHVYVFPFASSLSAARTASWNAPIPGFTVADVLGDGSREVAATSYASESSSGGVAFSLELATGRLLRSAPQTPPSAFGRYVQSLGAGQLDVDAALEICLAGESTLACFDGATFAEQWRVTLPSAAKSLQIAEIDGDLYPEVLVGTKDYFVFAFDGETGWLKWRTPNLSLWGSGFDLLRIVDLDGGFPLEVVAAASGSNDGQLTTFASDTGLTSAGPWSLPLNSLMPAAREDSPTLLLAGNNAGQVYPVDPLTGVAGAQIASFSSPVESFGLADFNRDGTLDVAALHRNRFEVHDGATGLPLWESPYLGNLFDSHDRFLVGDLDGDSIAEILVATRSGLALFESPLFAVFTDGFESGDTSNW